MAQIRKKKNVRKRDLPEEDEKVTELDLHLCLQRMVSEGLATVEIIDGEDVYELTPKGVEYYEKHLKDAKDED